jgi:hypothetical protein
MVESGLVDWLIRSLVDLGIKEDNPFQLPTSKSAATSRGGPGPFQVPSSPPQLCWWSLITEDSALNLELSALNLEFF